MRKEIEDCVRRCEKCQTIKLLRPRKWVPMEINITSSKPFEKCALVFVGPLVEISSRRKYILTFQYELSKFIVAIPLP
jgi:hypothetical protein